MPNIREIKLNLDVRKLNRERFYHWPETSIIGYYRHLCMMEFMNLNDYDQLWVKAFKELLAVSESYYECLRKYAPEGPIFEFLSSAHKLKKLALGLDLKEHLNVGNAGPVQAVLPLAKIFGDNYVWKHLESFYFNGGNGYIIYARRRIETFLGPPFYYSPNLWPVPSSLEDGNLA
ncbi:hypothetical protein RUND412_010526, partial [Rhizina undulata]